MRRYLAAGAVLVLATLGVCPPAIAHEGGRVQLFVSRLEVVPAGSTWMVHVVLVDSDSGTPAPGFDVKARAVDASQRQVGPVTLTDPTGTGNYQAVLPVSPGPWTVSIQAGALPGGLPAVPFTKSWPVTVGDSGTAPPQEVAPAPAQNGASKLAARFEIGGPPGQSDLYVPVRLFVTHPDNGLPAPGNYDVFGSGTNAAGEQTEFFPMVEQVGPGTTPGLFAGYVIVPHGGTWTITGTVNATRSSPNSKAPPVTYAQASITTEVKGGALASAAGAAEANVAAHPLSALVLWVHSLLAIGWGLGVGLLALLALPSGRRFLSEAGANAIDRRLDSIVRLVWWTTVLVVWTGIYNIVFSIAYKLPGSLAQARTLLELPYARGYYLALGAKLATYTAMVLASIPIIREARRRADTWALHPPARANDVVIPDRSPWGDPASGGGGIAVLHRPSRIDPEATASRRRLPVRIPVGIIVAGGGILTLAVTLLKYFHLLSEVARQ